MKIADLDTPALLIDAQIMHENLTRMQKQADAWHVDLRPHTKTHKSPEIAKMQVQLGARGITVAKTGEAEVMAENGLDDIFIANEIVGTTKLKRIHTLCTRGTNVSFGVDSLEALAQIEQVFTSDYPAHLLVEVETGENRSGVTDPALFVELLETIARSTHIVFDGVFSHEGHSYSALDSADGLRLLDLAQRETLDYVKIARSHGFACKRVSIGSTPSLMNAAQRNHPLMDGITEIRPGTYVYMDAGQANAIGTYAQCAASVLATVISKPTADRVIADAGAKALTMQSRGRGVCQTEGKGRIVWKRDLDVTSVFDEHTIILDREFHDAVGIGEKIRIIPNHICPVVNLYDVAYLVSDGQVIAELPISARGKTT